MNNTRNKHQKQEQVNQQENQQQQTRQNPGPQKPDYNPRFHEEQTYQEHEHPEARLSR